MIQQHKGKRIVIPVVIALLVATAGFLLLQVHVTTTLSNTYRDLATRYYVNVCVTQGIAQSNCTQYAARYFSSAALARTFTEICYTPNAGWKDNQLLRASLIDCAKSINIALDK